MRLRAALSINSCPPGHSPPQQQHGACTRRLGDAGGQPVIVAKADLLGGDSVVLVDHRDRAGIQQACQSGSGVQITAPVLEILQRQEKLCRGKTMVAEQLRPETRQRDLPDRRGNLRLCGPAALC